jgi:hypothetical protein
MGLVLGGMVLVALVAVGAVFWLVASLADRGRTVNAAGTPSPVAATTATPTTPVATTPPVTTVPPTTVAPSTVAPAPSATAIVPTPKPTPAPTIRPVPLPTLSVPVGRLVRVPDVVGLKVAQAGSVLRAAGFRVQVIGGVLDPERDDRRIVAQRPTAGSVVRAGSTVILVTDGT